MKATNPLITLRRLVLVPKCAACGVRLEPFSQNDYLTRGSICFCDSCLEMWEEAGDELCHICYMNVDICNCFPNKEKFEQEYIPSVCFYHPEEQKIQNKVIYTLKHRHDKELFEFLARELAIKVENMLKEANIDIDKCVLTWIPRKRSSVLKYGFDQARELCKRLKEELGGVKTVALFRRYGGKEQKKLSAHQRRRNVTESILLSKKFDGIRKKKYNGLIKNYTVIIVDDVLTTGETLGRGASLLKKSGAKRVMVCCVARSDNSNDA